MLGGHAPRWLVVGLLLLAYGLALTSVVQKSPTMDEQNHIARGAAYLGTGDPRLSVEHPPVVNVLSALPAHLLLDLKLPLDQWWQAGEWYHFADNFLWRANQNPDRIILLARLPIIGLGLMLAALVFRWASVRFGPWGGLLAAAFCALDPNILAHERLSTTDLGGTLFAFLAAYALWRALRRPSPRRTLWAGITLGLAFAAKLSALAFGPILVLVALLDAAVDRSDQGRLLRQVARLTAVTSLALLVVWASYGFQVGSLEGVGFPVPAAPYVRGVLAVLDLSGGGRPAYLLGRISSEGWWYYFPVAFAVKTPLPTLAALLLASVLTVRCVRWDDVWFLVPSVAYFLASMTSGLNIGYRHLLPMLPFLAVQIGRLTELPVYQSTSLPTYLRRLVPVGLAVWLAISTIIVYPHFMAYFNAIAGGPENGWHILADSNIDWGQDLKGLQRWTKQENVDRVRLSWFGSAYPEHYGITYDPLPGVGFPSHFELWSDPPFSTASPEPGIYVISVNNLLGLNLPNPDLYAWFRARRPDAKIGYSVFIYRVVTP